MIPISADAVLEWTDEKSGIVYKFRPQVGRVDLLINKYYSFHHKRSKPFRKEAESQLKETAFETEEKCKLAIEMLASELAGESFSDTEDYLKIVDEIVDTALLGWSGVGAPAFPQNGKPSEMFKMLEKTVLLTAYININNLSEDDKKN